MRQSVEASSMGGSRGVRARRWTEAEGAEVVAAWASSGQSVRGFARARGLTPQRVDWWRKKLARASGESPRSSFIAVRVRPAVVKASEGTGGASVVVAIDAALRVEVRDLSAESATWVALLARRAAEDRT